MRLLRTLQRAFGLETISDELPLACAHRVQTRCSRLDLTAYRRKPGQGALEHEARAAIVGAFKDFYPDRAHKFQETGHWPYAHAIIRGNRAWIEISIGIDYEDPDEGLDVIEIQVDRLPKQISLKEKIEDVLFNRAPRIKASEKPPVDLIAKAPPLKEQAPTGKPEMVLTKAVDPKPVSSAKPAQNPSPRKAVTPTPAPKTPPPLKPGSGKLRAK